MEDELTMTEVCLLELNDYHGDNIWQDVIYWYSDEARTDEIGRGKSDRFITYEGDEIRYDAERGEWMRWR